MTSQAFSNDEECGNGHNMYSVIHSWQLKMKRIYTIVSQWKLGHNFVISWFTDFLAAKTGWSVGKKLQKIQKALLCQVVEKSYRYMEIVIKSDVLRNY